MIITISGTPGSGKSTVARLVAKKLNLKHYSSGDFMRDMAEERKISLLEISEQAEKDRSIDEEIDQRQMDLGRNEDNFIIDARLGFHFIPNSIKIFLNADFEERAKRILADIIRKEHNINLKNMKERIKIREDSEKKRYKNYYSLDLNDKQHYDHIINTTKISAEEVADKIISLLEKHKA